MFYAKLTFPKRRVLSNRLGRCNARKTQHCCQTPSVAVIGRQCHIQPSGRRAAPMFEVSSLKVWVPSPEPEDLPTRFVDVLVASFSKVPMMSEARHTHSSWESRYSLCVAHSPQACALVSSAIPAPFGF